MLYKVESTNCPGCKKLEGMLNHLGVEATHLNIETEEGLKFAQEHKISTVPSLVKITDNNVEIMLGLKSLQEVSEFCKK